MSRLIHSLMSNIYPRCMCIRAYTTGTSRYYARVGCMNVRGCCAHPTTLLIGILLNARLPRNRITLMCQITQWSIRNVDSCLISRTAVLLKDSTAVGLRGGLARASGGAPRARERGRRGGQGRLRRPCFSVSHSQCHICPSKRPPRPVYS